MWPFKKETRGNHDPEVARENANKRWAKQNFKDMIDAMRSLKDLEHQVLTNKQMEVDILREQIESEYEEGGDTEGLNILKQLFDVVKSEKAKAEPGLQPTTATVDVGQSAAELSGDKEEGLFIAVTDKLIDRLISQIPKAVLKSVKSGLIGENEVINYCLEQGLNKAVARKIYKTIKQ